jgi:hypothetical protein
VPTFRKACPVATTSAPAVAEKLPAGRRATG